MKTVLCYEPVLRVSTKLHAGAKTCLKNVYMDLCCVKKLCTSYDYLDFTCLCTVVILNTSRYRWAVYAEQCTQPPYLRLIRIVSHTLISSSFLLQPLSVSSSKSRHCTSPHPGLAVHSNLSIVRRKHWNAYLSSIQMQWRLSDFQVLYWVGVFRKQNQPFEVCFMASAASGRFHPYLFHSHASEATCLILVIEVWKSFPLDFEASFVTGYVVSTRSMTWSLGYFHDHSKTVCNHLQSVGVFSSRQLTFVAGKPYQWIWTLERIKWWTLQLLVRR